MKWFLKCFKQYADFGGRARRSEYWWFMLINFINTMILIVGTFVPLIKLGMNYSSIDDMDDLELIKAIANNPFFYLYIIYYLAVLIPSISVSVRRLHDIGRSGYWYFLFIGCSMMSSLTNVTTGIVRIILTLVVLALSILFLVWMFTDSQPGTNIWGPNPKEPQPTEQEQQ